MPLRPLLLLLAACALPAENGPEVVPGIPGAVGQATVRLEFLGKGFVPTARVLITNPLQRRAHLSRNWTYEVVPQDRLTDRTLAASLPAARDDRFFALAELACLPESRIWLTLDEDEVFRSGNDRKPIDVAPGKAWGHDHPLDLRPAKLRAQIVFVRLHVPRAATRTDGEDDPVPKGGAQEFTSDWMRYLLPDVPDLPLVRFSGDARKLGETQFARAAKGAATFVATAASGDYPWTRVLTLAKDDPLAAAFPQLLLDGKSNHVVADGEPFRFAVSGIDGTTVDPDATVIAVQQLR